MILIMNFLKSNVFFYIRLIIIKGIIEYVQVQKNAYPPNILQWAGASILGNLKQIEKMGLSKEDYIKANKELKDKYWEMLNANYEKTSEFTGPKRPTHMRRSSSVAYKKRLSLIPSTPA